MNKTPFNKNSQYVQSLVDFILDTKPYHSKLTEVVEEYQFNDDVNVKIEERLLIRAKLDATWQYNYYSSGNPNLRTLPIQRVVNPSFTAWTAKTGTDENTDMALVPMVYNKKSIDHLGVNDVFVRRNGGAAEPLAESIDWFEGHGSFQFQIKQTVDANGDFNPLWTATNDEGIIHRATVKTRKVALDLANPSSAVNRVRLLLDEIRATNAAHGNDFSITVALNSLYAILNVPDLPKSYENVLAYVNANPGVRDSLPRPLFRAGGHEEDSYEGLFQKLSSPLFFGMYTDSDLRESGLVQYEPVTTDRLRVFNIVPNVDNNYEEWLLTAVDDDTSTWSITGSQSGFVGFITAGESFNSAGKISFQTQGVSQPNVGDTVSVAPNHKITIHKNAPLETWNIIKVNSISMSRPMSTSVHYGRIQDVNGNVGLVTITDPTMPTTDIILEARDDGVTFDLYSVEEPQHQGVVTADESYSDEWLSFTVASGDQPFHKGDRFIIGIENPPAQAVNLDLGYGYDLDPYDNDHVVDTANRPLTFGYDGRFVDYNTDLMNLAVTQNAVNMRKFRIKAVPNTSTPVATLKKNGSGPFYQIDLMDATSGVAPDPALTSIPVYSMAGDANTAPDLFLYYSDSFEVQYSDNDFHTTYSIGFVAVGGTFTSAQHGISFKVPAASRPFVAVSSDDGLNQPRVEGGDVFSFEILNPPPFLTESPIGLSSAYIPRMVLRADSFYESVAAKWQVSFDTPTTYTITATLANGLSPAGYPKTLPLAENYSHKDQNIHFTIKPGPGLFANDLFTFETFADKPSYLVHGSVTGWTKPAKAGQYYWNGKIGFKITLPEYEMYAHGTVILPSIAKVFVTRLREDTPSLTYILTETTSGYQVSRSDLGAVGFVGATGTWSDRYITLNLTGAVQAEIKIDINAHDYPLFTGIDTVIIKPKVKARAPLVNDTMVIEKTEAAQLQISLTPTPAVNVTDLAPITIDQRFIDLDTNGDIPLSSTSPETSILQGWLPLIATKMDSETSIAQFSDPAIRTVYTTATSGETVGVVRQQDTNINEPILFEWNNDFFVKYLPLNAEANLVVTGTGWDDKTRVKITESIKFLIGGGALDENWLFHDDVNVHFTEANLFKISTNYAGSMTVDVEDGPFGGFLSGYANQQYDNEANGYDEGRAPDLYSLLARANLPTYDRQAILDQWDFFLLDGDVPTVEQQWAFVRTWLNLDPNPGVVVDDLGYPAIGLGMDVVDRSTGSASASFQEAMVLLARDYPNGYDNRNYDIGPLDSQAETTALMYSGSLPPVPATIPPGTTYASLDTPLYTITPTRVFEVMFTGTTAQLAALNPTFRVWLPTAAAPQVIPSAIVTKVSAGKYRFSIPAASEAKVLVN